MGMILVILGGICVLAAFVCSIIILIDAFQNEIWKGIVYLLCGLYAIYYALVEFDHEKKWLIVLTAVLGSLVGWGLIMAGTGMSATS